MHEETLFIEALEIRDPPNGPRTWTGSVPGTPRFAAGWSGCWTCTSGRATSSAARPAPPTAHGDHLACRAGR